MLAEYELAGTDKAVIFAGMKLHRFEAIVLFDELESQRWLHVHTRIAKDAALTDFLSYGEIPEQFDTSGFEKEDKLIDFIAPYFMARFNVLSGEAWTKRDSRTMKRLSALPLLVPRQQIDRCFKTLIEGIGERTKRMLDSWESLRWRPHYFSDAQCDVLCNHALIDLLCALPEAMHPHVEVYFNAVLSFCDYLAGEQNEYIKAHELFGLAGRLPRNASMQEKYAAMQERMKNTPVTNAYRRPSPIESRRNANAWAQSWRVIIIIIITVTFCGWLWRQLKH